MVLSLQERYRGAPAGDVSEEPVGLENEDERAIYQLLCKEKTTLSATDIKKIKEVAKQLLIKLLGAKNQLQYLRDRAALQAQMKVEIFDYLFDKLPQSAFNQDEVLNRSQRVFDHFYSSQIRRTS